MRRLELCDWEEVAGLNEEFYQFLTPSGVLVVDSSSSSSFPLVVGKGEEEIRPRCPFHCVHSLVHSPVDEDGGG